MPSAVTVLCQIKSKGLDGGFVNGLANYMISPNMFKTFHYGFYKKQTSPLTFHEFNIKDYVLISGKCLFDNEDMYIMISTAFKIELIEDEIPSTGPYISFVGKIYSRPKQDEDDCVFGINVSEYNNNFNFTNKGKVNFKIQVVYDAGQDSRFRKLAPKLEIGKLVFIAGLLDLSENDLPFVEAREIDLLENSIDDLPNTSSSQSLFSRTQKFKTNKPISIKKEKSLDNEIEKPLSTGQNQDDKSSEEQSDDEIDHKSVTNLTNQGGKRKNQLADLSLRRLKKAKNLDNNDEEFGLDNQVTGKELSQPTKRKDKKRSNKTTKVTTRSQKKDEKELIEDNADSNI
ncbi:unnamed protein product [Rhizophagus irregularis]|uniref:Uncharacterized protein n=1 Tax=Rhizophagus irregularis TaxID=588596 RepID=A0A2I1H2D3_9GLOM|nr:hypothetical protein RhiirA4_425730 [Rhizophagus irregularis]CAB4438026.1 unnamed protein product [Rhizophagus irregularis]